jgi:hypothetical protein
MTFIFYDPEITGLKPAFFQRFFIQPSSTIFIKIE